MGPAVRALGERWEQELGDPASRSSRIGFCAALELDENEAFPHAQLDALKQLGCFELLIPAREGGALQEPEQLILLARLIARRDLTTAIAFGQTMLGSLPVWLAGSEAQKQLLASELRQGRLGCLALTEKAHGGDIFASEFRGRQHGDGWILSGEKWLINNGRMGANVTVLGRIEHSDRMPELALWWLQKTDPDSPHWRAHPKIPTHGIRGADISGFELLDHAIGPGSRLQGSEPALNTALKTLQISRVLCSGFSLGAADTMFRLTLAFARERRLYGKRAIDIPIVRARLAQCFASIMAADAVAQVASRAIAVLPRELSLLSAVTKCYVPVEIESVGRELSAVLGARHYLRDEPWGMFQKMLRDSQVVSLFDGSTPVNLSLIAAQLRALAENLAAPRASLNEEVLASLLRVDDACPGWPTQGELQLTNQGRDSLAAAFIHGSELQAHGRPWIDALHAQWQQWLHDCQQATRVQRLPHGSVAVMRLAERYVNLHSCTVLTLARRMNGSARTPLGDAMLQTYLACKLAQAGIEPPEHAYDVVLDTAIALVDDARLLSLQSVRLD